MIKRPFVSDTSPGSDVVFGGITPATAMEPTMNSTVNKKYKMAKREIHLKTDLIAFILFFSFDTLF
jgi:hypothetical protein